MHHKILQPATTMNMHVNLFNKLVTVSQSNFKFFQMVIMPFHVQSLSGHADVSVYPNSKRGPSSSSITLHVSILPQETHIHHNLWKLGTVGNAF